MAHGNVSPAIISMTQSDITFTLAPKGADGNDKRTTFNNIKCHRNHILVWVLWLSETIQVALAERLSTKKLSESHITRLSHANIVRGAEAPFNRTILTICEWMEMDTVRQGISSCVVV